MTDFPDLAWEAADRFTPELMELVGDPFVFGGLGR